jgi:hypothetical protein
VHGLIRDPGREGPGRERAGRPGGRTAAAGVALAACVLGSGLAGCAKMDQALAKQWMQVDFGPDTSVATALHVRAACSHIQNTPPLPLPKTQSVLNVMYGIGFDTTNSSPANLAQLQSCLSKFKSVLGVNSQDTGDEGS